MSPTNEIQYNIDTNEVSAEKKKPNFKRRVAAGLMAVVAIPGGLAACGNGVEQSTHAATPTATATEKPFSLAPNAPETEAAPIIAPMESPQWKSLVETYKSLDIKEFNNL